MSKRNIIQKLKQAARDNVHGKGASGGERYPREHLKGILGAQMR